MNPATTHQVVQVALKVPFADHLDYAIDQATTMPQVGCRVVVPLGRNKQLVGVVVGLPGHSEHQQLKPVTRVLETEPLFNQKDLMLLKKAARYYQVSWGEMILTALPVWFKKTDNNPVPEELWWQTSATPAAAKQALSKAPRQWDVFHYLYQHGPLTSKSLSHLSASAAQICRQLQDKNLLSASPVCQISNQHAQNPGFTLTDDQQSTLKHLLSHDAAFRVMLLDGITGSGKTEVYIRFIQHVLSKAQQVLVLVPEIGLTPQLFQEISHRIDGQLAVLHSGLSAGARARVWQHAHQGLVDVVVATRSGIFTPFKELGAIIVDEEHDLSYKQQEGVRYSARDMAVLRGQHINIPVVLGSATPGFESFNHAREGRYDWLKLRSRTNQSPLPVVRLQNTLNKKQNHGLSHESFSAIVQQLEAGHQVLVFLNRRGWSPRLLCHDCGWVAMCDDCDAALTYHKHLGLLRCHHCERRYSLPEFCPECGSQEVETMGVGTERLASGLIEQLGEDQVIRFDRDAVRTPKQWQQSLNQIRQARPCVIVGTQMLAKGHDFPLLSLVVVVNVDNSFFSVDFRAMEHLAQLMIQVSGRAGRAQTRGEVILQTQFPEHPFFNQLFDRGYEAFASEQLKERAEMMFPPFAHLAIIKAQHHDERTLDQWLTAMVEFCSGNEQVSVMGPLPATLAKKQKQHRMQIIFSAAERKFLHHLIQQLKQHFSPRKSKVLWFVDIDPVSFD
ncbi:primosomal protein N' [Marinicella sediminis]|uniref:Replication restart protein PriA n=1 Tax=Marinicella sediminis TaxID=1792834 RepID=A0ABV7JDQ5_9GAMM|nr:primosomal protein N' [Marinicella sediminis]